MTEERMRKYTHPRKRKNASAAVDIKMNLKYHAVLSLAFPKTLVSDHHPGGMNKLTSVPNQSKLEFVTTAATAAFDRIHNVTSLVLKLL